MAQSDTSNFPK